MRDPAQSVLPGPLTPVRVKNRDSHIMRWIHSEYLLKGVFLGLLLNVALRQAGLTEFNWDAPLRVALCVFGGLLLALLVAGFSKLRAGYHVRGRLAPFILFLL